jgi:hypothetical protein
MASIMSVDLSMTMTAAVPRPDCASFSASKSIRTSSQILLGRQGTDEPPAHSTLIHLMMLSSDAASTCPLSIMALSWRAHQGFIKDAGLASQMSRYVLCIKKKLVYYTKRALDEVWTQDTSKISQC